MVTIMPTGKVIPYVVALSRRHTNELGFLPRPRLEAYHERGQLWVEYDNNEPCGFVVWGNGWPVLRIYQICIAYDARRQTHGLNLIRRIIQKADAGGYEAISCFVADDLDANLFWRDAGFTLCGTRQGGHARGRWHNHWVMRMPIPIQRALFEEVYHG